MTTEYVIMNKENGQLGIGLKAILRNQEIVANDSNVVISMSYETDYFWMFSYQFSGDDFGISTFITKLKSELPEYLEILGDL